MLKLLGHCLEGEFEVFLVSDKLDHLETKRKRVHSVDLNHVIIYIILDNKVIISLQQKAAIIFTYFGYCIYIF